MDHTTTSFSDLSASLNSTSQTISGSTLLASSLLGVCLHVFTLRHGEWDLYTAHLLTVYLGIALALYLYAFVCSTYETTASSGTVTLQRSLTLLLSSTAGLYVSVLVYRGFFHKLCSFRGPFLARFSNFYVSYLSAKKLRLHTEVQELHKQYGSVVRIGPSELSVTLPNALHAIHGQGTGCSKGPWYNVLWPMVSLQMIRNRSDHMQRRRIWDRGFGAKALRDYEPRVVKYTDQLITKIDSSNGKSLDATLWFNFYSFDVMGDLAFGQNFGMLASGKKHYFMTELHETMRLNGLFSHLMWLYPIFKGTPIINAGYLRFMNWLKQTVEKRRQMKVDSPDVFFWLLQKFEDPRYQPTKQEEIDLIGDAYLIAVAGSDTTAATLTCMFYELTQNPEVLKTLQAEVDNYFEEHEVIESTSLAKMEYLNAVINETMRLHPAVPSGLQRMTPADGITIDGVFIPGNTIVQIPSYTMYRDATYFARPEEFVPTRWTTERNLVINSNCYAPFSIGHSSCIGKHLGLMEVRHVTARILRSYMPQLAPGYTPQRFIESETDTFTLALGPLDMVFERR